MVFFVGSFGCAPISFISVSGSSRFFSLRHAPKAICPAVFGDRTRFVTRVLQSFFFQGPVVAQSQQWLLCRGHCKLHRGVAATVRPLQSSREVRLLGFLDGFDVIAPAVIPVGSELAWSELFPNEEVPLVSLLPLQLHIAGVLRATGAVFESECPKTPISVCVVCNLAHAALIAFDWLCCVEDCWSQDRRSATIQGVDTSDLFWRHTEPLT